MITLEQFGVFCPFNKIKMPIHKAPASLPKRSGLKFGNIVYRIEDGRVGIVIDVTTYNGGFEYTVLTPTRGTFKAKVSIAKDPETLAPKKEEIEWLRKGNAFRRVG